MGRSPSLFAPTDSRSAFVAALAATLIGLFFLTACDMARAIITGPTLTPRAVITRLVVVTSTPMADASVAHDTPTPSVTHVVLSSTGRVLDVQMLANNQARVKLSPDDPGDRSEFVIGSDDWQRLTVWFYWAGLETPTPVADANKPAIVKDSLERQVTIGYTLTDPQGNVLAQPQVVFFGSRKKPGDPQ